MPQANRSTEWFVWGAILLTVLAIAFAFVRSEIKPREQKDTTDYFDPGQHIELHPIVQLPDFTLTNQDGGTVTLADLRGSVCVADIIFTRCAGPCPVMTQRMSELQKALPADDRIKFITLTTDPEFDGPEVMKRFGERFKADFRSWSFLTGSKEQIARLAADGLKLTAIEKKPSDRETERDLFIHSPLFVLVDKKGRLRGSVESGDPRLKQKMLAAVKQLIREK